MRRGSFPRRPRHAAKSAPREKQRPSVPSVHHRTSSKKQRRVSVVSGGGMGSGGRETAGTVGDWRRIESQLELLIHQLTNSGCRTPRISVYMQTQNEAECSLFYPTLPPVRSLAISEGPLAEVPGPPKCGSSFCPCGVPLKDYVGPRGPVGSSYRGCVAAKGETRFDQALRLAAAAVTEAVLHLPQVTVQLREAPGTRSAEAAAPPSSGARGGRGVTGRGPREASANIETGEGPSDAGANAEGPPPSALQDHSEAPGRLAGYEGLPRSPLPSRGVEGRLSGRGPLLVLLGGPSGSGKSTMLPLLLHVLSRTFPSLQHLHGWSGAGGSPRPYALLSTDALRQVLRAFCPPMGGPEGLFIKKLLFSSTYRLKDLAEAQLRQKSPSRAAAAANAASSPANSPAPNAAAAAAAAATDAAAAGDTSCQRFNKHAELQREIIEALKEELGALHGAPNPLPCDSCKEAAPCSALLGMLQQAVLLQHLILEPLVVSLMGPPAADGATRGGPCPEGSGALELVLVEGVHLTPAFAARMQRRYGLRCLSLVAFCHTREEHARRLARREEDTPLNAAVAAAAEAGHPPGAVAATAQTVAAATAEAEQVRYTKDREEGPFSCRGEGAPPGQEASTNGPRGGPPFKSNTSSRSNSSCKSSSTRNSGSGNKYLRSLSCIRCVQLHLCLAAASTLTTTPNSSNSSSSSSSRGLLQGSDAAAFFISEVGAPAKGHAATSPGPPQDLAVTNAVLGAPALGALDAFLVPRGYPIPTDDVSRSLRLVQQVALKHWGPL